MTSSDPIGVWLAASVATGVAAHVAATARHRRTYRRLRAAYLEAVSSAQETGAADALVRAQELHREFMRSTRPGWFTGAVARLEAALVVCAAGGVALMVATGRLPSVVAGIGVLLAIGLRRILLATALLLALFAATSVLSPPRPVDRATTAHRPAAPKPPRAPAP